MAKYTIKKGDTLSSIAREFNTTVDVLVETNGIENKNLIYAGHTIDIPDSNTDTSLTGGGNVSYTVTDTNSGAVTDNTLKSDVSNSYTEWKNKDKPSYNSVYKDDIENTSKELSEREFSYDVNEDEAYHRYRDSVKNSAELALADAMGIATSLTGGYSNSYAQLVGQAAYADTMKAADEKIPEFYKEAYNRYSEETDNIEDRLEILLDMDDAEWDRYIDMLDEYNDEGERLFDQMRDMSDEEFDRFYAMYKLSVK